MRLSSEQRRAVIVTSACRIATSRGLWAVTHGSVAARCTVPTSLNTVRHYFATKDDLWRAVLVEESEHEALHQQAREMGFEV